MHTALDISKELYDKLESELGALIIFRYIEEYGQGNHSIYHYADTHGNFIDDKTPHGKIAKVIFEQLSPKDKLTFFQYLEWLNEEEN